LVWEPISDDALGRREGRGRIQDVGVQHPLRIVLYHLILYIYEYIYMWLRRLSRLIKEREKREFVRRLSSVRFVSRLSSMRSLSNRVREFVR
jgi:hypothetical protein